METISDLIDKLIEIRDKEGNIRLGGNLQFHITGISYKYLIVASNHPTHYPPKTEDSNE